MFERFTHRARHAIVLAQNEARALQHNYIGSEHLLLGLLGEPEGVAARALDPFGIVLATARQDVTTRVPVGNSPVEGHLPFTPRAKKVLELALREALALHHHYIGTEHLLLGVIREADGVGAQIIAARVGDLLKVRMAVLDLVPPAQSGGPRWRLRDLEAGADPGETKGVHATPAADTTLSEAVRLAGPRPVGSHHLLLATLGDPASAAARTLTTLGVDLDQAREALRAVDVTGTTDEQPEDAGRRRMLIRVTDDRLAVEVTDRTLLDAAHAALKALGDRPEPPPPTRRYPRRSAGQRQPRHRLARHPRQPRGHPPASRRDHRAPGVVGR